jgi:hypothetical protein
VELAGVEKEGRCKEDCIHKSFSLGVVVRYQETEYEKEIQQCARVKKTVSLMVEGSSEREFGICGPQFNHMQTQGGR